MSDLDLSHVRLCACGNLRRATRALTQWYDAALAPCGLRVTQFTVLVVTAKLGPITVNRLADVLGTDRTTLTRNLAPLTQRGWIGCDTGDDQRTRIVTLTARGRKTLAKALPYWEQAQSRIVKSLGANRFNDFLGELAAIESLAR